MKNSAANLCLNGQVREEKDHIKLYSRKRYCILVQTQSYYTCPQLTLQKDFIEWNQLHMKLHVQRWL